MSRVVIACSCGVVERYGSDEASPEMVLLDKEKRAEEDSATTSVVDL
jgi:hypothetical protein